MPKTGKTKAFVSKYNPNPRLEVGPKQAIRIGFQNGTVLQLQRTLRVDVDRTSPEIIKLIHQSVSSAVDENPHLDLSKKAAKQEAEIYLFHDVAVGSRLEIDWDLPKTSLGDSVMTESVVNIVEVVDR